VSVFNFVLCNVGKDSTRLRKQQSRQPHKIQPRTTQEHAQERLCKKHIDDSLPNWSEHNRITRRLKYKPNRKQTIHHRSNPSKKEKRNKQMMISFSNALIYPRTVVVKLCNTLIAKTNIEKKKSKKSKKKIFFFFSTTGNVSI
jgi:hypothetical protein